MSSFSNISFQNASSPLMEELIFFHDHIMTILTLITMVVSYSMTSIFKDLNLNKSMIESQPLEFFWTVTPTFILILIGMPSIRLLYMLDEVFNPLISLKIMGHQWYWSYEYSDFVNMEFDSFMTTYIATNNVRLLNTDNYTTLPFNTQVRALISSTDVLHSWTIPSLGIKVDAVPGRLNQLNFLATRPGLFYGQCSEICGANHSFMPIVIETINLNFFIKWIHKTL